MLDVDHLDARTTELPSDLAHLARIPVGRITPVNERLLDAPFGDGRLMRRNHAVDHIKPGERIPKDG